MQRFPQWPESVKPSFFQLPDGLAMATYFRPGRGTPVLCLPGLTRNHRDFAPLLEALPERPVYAVDLRGRGRSDRDPDPSSYTPQTYAEDIKRWLADVSEPVLDVVGTSLGGILAMDLAGSLAGRIRRLVINDIGVTIEQAGLTRIAGSVGVAGPLRSWDEAALAVRAGQLNLHPRQEDWLGIARTLCVERDGGIEFDYDPAIRQSAEGPPPSLWPLFEMTYDHPVLLLRGETSDLLSHETALAMCQAHGRADYLEVSRTGHAPRLNEPEAIEALQRFLAD